MTKDTRKQRQIRKERWKAFKETLECQLCGENHPNCLEFHHLDPNEKDFNIGTMIKRLPFEEVKKELDKCAVLCSNCHRKVHAGALVLS